MKMYILCNRKQYLPLQKQNVKTFFHFKSTRFVSHCGLCQNGCHCCSAIHSIRNNILKNLKMSEKSIKLVVAMGTCYWKKRRKDMKKGKTKRKANTEWGKNVKYTHSHNAVQLDEFLHCVLFGIKMQNIKPQFFYSSKVWRER